MGRVSSDMLSDSVLNADQSNQLSDQDRTTACPEFGKDS